MYEPTHREIRWASLVFGVLPLLAGPAGADTGLARHKKIYAVPAPTNVVVDGKLDDWDLSGQIQMYVVSETADMQSARFALMHDADAVYVSGVVRDPSPMMNRHDPKVDPEKAWDADVCQIYMVLDPAMGYPVNKSSFGREVDDRICTLYLWYYTDRREPNLACFKGMTFDTPLRQDLAANGAIPHDRFQAAFVKAEDGRGYTFEYRIPWATLGAKSHPKAGDVVAGAAQFCWSAPDGFKTAGGSAWAYDVMSGPGFVFQSTACWGKFIFSDQGRIPKEMVEEGLPPEKPLPLTFAYDLPEESEVSIALFDPEGRAVRTLVAQAARRAGRNVERWDGLDDAGKPLAAGQYVWRGLYHQPVKTRFVLSAHNSGQPPYKTDDNTGGWGGDHGCPTAVCAVGDAVILTWNMSESGWGIIRTDLNGRKQWGIKHNAEDVATDGRRLLIVGDHGFNGEDSVKLFDPGDGRPLNWGNGKPALDPPAGGDPKTNVARGVAHGRSNVYVSWTDRNLVGVYDDQSGNLLETWNVPTPGRLAVRPDGSVAVISQGKIVLAAKVGATPWISDHVDEPVALAAGPDGALYVANRGRLQNVSVFSPEGKFAGSIGQQGGRPRVGRYDPAGILEPGGITLDANGHLWVAETLDAPKRHSVWHAKTGKLVREFFGASSYFGWASMDPERPDELYCHNVLWKIDLDKGTCLPQSTIWRATAPNMIREPNPSGYAGHFRVFTAGNGKQFGWGMIDYSNMLFLRVGDLFKPLAGTIRIAHGPYGGGVLYPAMGDSRKYPEGAYLWQDANDDQSVQENELSVSPAGRGEVVFNWIDRDLNAWCDSGWIYKPARFLADGRPVYDFGRREPIPWKGGNSNCTSLWLDDQDDTVYTLAPGGQPGFARWTREGKLIWGYGSIIPWHDALSLPMVAPGRLWGLTMPLGVAGDYTGAACYFGPYHIFTRDGVYVAMVMRDGRSGGLGADITASETLTGQLVKPRGMNRYFLLAGDQDGRVTEIVGLDTVKRLPGGVYVHASEDVQAAAKALADYERAKVKSQRLDIARGKPGLPTAKPVTRPVDDKRSFAARAAYDEKNLYVGFDVSSPAELVNEISDWRLVFTGGNCLDIQMATDSAADPHRTTPAPGDLRFVITRQKDKPLAVVYRPKLKGFVGQPIVLTSATGRESFDAIEKTDKIGLEYQKTSGGFRAVIAVPLELLGWSPSPGQTVKMDLGYLFGNATGSQVSLRAYWTNNSFSANVTNDVPNESRLEPHEWGTAAVE